MNVKRFLSRRAASARSKLAASLVRAAARRLVRGPRHARWPLGYELVIAVMRDAMHRDHEGSARAMRKQKGRVPASLAQRVSLSHETIAGVPCEVHTPRGYRTGEPTVLYLHGGGYVSCSPATHRELIARLAHSAGARCIAPDYRLAPEHPYPAALDDACAVYEALIASGVAARALFIAGDSAGGGLALATLLRLRAQERALPRAALLLSPWVDLSLSEAAMRAFGPYDYLNAKMLAETAPKYAGATRLDDPSISPIYADLRGLPPMLVQTGSWEVFSEQNTRFVERARAHGVDVKHELEEGLLHVYPAFAAVLPEARKALRSLAEFVRSFSLGASEHDGAQPASPVKTAALS